MNVQINPVPGSPTQHYPSKSARLTLFAMPFRPFFLMGSLWALCAIPLWLMWLTGLWQPRLLLPAVLWHAHELIFGFGATIAAGFLLTAAQTWTNVRSVSGTPLIILCTLWLIARITLFLGDSPFSWTLLFCTQLAWWTGIIMAFSVQVLSARSKQNYRFIVILSAMMLLNLLMLSLTHYAYLEAALHISRGMILLFCILMSVVGARVIPFFTSRVIPQVKADKNAYLDAAILWLSVLGSLNFLLSPMFSQLPNPGWLMCVAGLLHVLRLGKWYHHEVFRHPLLWSLHLAYLAMALGLIMLGLSHLTAWFAVKDMLHLLSISAMSGMILAMLARVSLGHTGRPLMVTKLVAISLSLLLIAGPLRAFAGLSQNPVAWWLLSGILWSSAFAIFLFRYIPILVSPRVDGRPG